MYIQYAMKLPFDIFVFIFASLLSKFPFCYDRNILKLDGRDGWPTL